MGQYWLPASIIWLVYCPKSVNFIQLLGAYDDLASFIEVSSIVACTTFITNGKSEHFCVLLIFMLGC